MKFLITGGAGFIGSSIAEYLISQGHRIRILDNFSNGNNRNLEFAKTLNNDLCDVIRDDIRDRNVAQRACEGMDIVLHQAGLRSVPESLKIPDEYKDVNGRGTLIMLEAAKKKKVSRFIFASSSAVYGNSTKLPNSEDHTPMPMSPYAATKLEGENHCRDFWRNYGLSTVALRYFNVFGPKQAPNDEYSAVIPKFIQCVKNSKPTPIFGDGGQSRDFVHIQNVILANYLAATTLGITHEVLNIALGESNTLLNLSKTLNKILNGNIPPQFLPVRPGDIYTSQADITKARKILGYRPTVNFEEGLRQTAVGF